MPAAEMPAHDGELAPIFHSAIKGRRAGRQIAAWAKAQGLSEPELQLLWCLQVADGAGLDQTTLAERLAYSPAQVSGLVERLQATGRIVQQPAREDRRRHAWRLAESGATCLQRLAASEPPDEVALTARATANKIGNRAAAALVLLAALVCLQGCTRSYYRRQADKEVNCIIDHKAEALGTAPGQLRIDIDPRSRMYDPDDPDCPPMPPDDPVSHELMQCIDCKPGAPCWRHSPHTPYADNPHWEEFLPRDNEGQVVLDMQGAVQMALLQSTEYQEQLETLYLSSLDVTFERFRFDTQYFGGSSLFFTSDGPERSGTGFASSALEVSPLRSGNPLRAQKLTTTGGELVVGVANSLVWQFAGPDDYTSNTLLDFSLVQPLLRAGGRARVMERLTIAERALLANVRQMEQYRGAFYLNVVTGSGSVYNSGLRRRGGFFGGSGLEGFAGVGGGGFGQVGGFGGGGSGSGFGFTGGAGAQQAGGYMGLLQTAQIIRNQYSNIASLGDSVEQLAAAHDAGRIDRFQVDLAKQALYNAQSQLLNSAAQYQTSLDNFKVQYGMPPDLNLQISDPLLNRFNLLDPKLSKLQIEVTDALNVLREGTKVAATAQQEDAETEAGELDLFHDEQRVVLSAEELAELTTGATAIAARSREQLAAADRDFAQMEAALPTRRLELEKLGKREDAQEMEISGDLLSIENLDARTAALRHDLAELTRRLETTWTRIDALGTSSQPPAALQKEMTGALTELSGELLELSLLQARARLDAITFETVDLTPEEGFCIASHNRRDWMNARAALVDSWRLITFNADDLQSDLDFVFSGDLGNSGDNPFRLNGNNGRLRMGLEFDAPLTRLAERNLYRQSLIEYQQARRSYYRFRDNVHRTIRGTLRQMRVDQLNFELRREAVHTAITQVDLARLRLSEPARPVAAAAPGTPLAPGGQSQFGDTVARDLVQALIDLLNVQNDFLSVWVDHEVQRLQLDFDLGIMELDPHGQRMEHTQPLRAFLAQSGCAAPFELPAPCREATADMPESPDEDGDDMLPSLDLLPAAEPGLEQGPAFDPPDAEAADLDAEPHGQRLPLSRFTRR